MDDYIAKPFQMNELVAAIERVHAGSADTSVVCVDSPEFVARNN
jgi:DNA-binding response OmpR family regulator